MADKQGKSVADQLVDLVADGELFVDQLGESYYSPDGTGIDTLAVKSTAFKRYLCRKFYQLERRSVGENPLRQALTMIDALANDHEVKELEVRVARDDDAVWYDLGAGAVRVDGDGWEVSLNPPIKFRRYQHQKTQVEPIRGGSVSKVLQFVNLPDPESQILFMALLTSYFIPGFPHPVAAIYGSMGAGKTAMSRLIKDLVDPSEISEMTPPRNEEQFIQTASHHYLLPLDNLSYMPQWLSDLLSRTVTGMGFSKRQLYTDSDDIFYSFRRGVVLNGINLVTQAPDLLDRSIIFPLERVPEKSRLKEDELKANFAEAKPRILGAIFDAVSAGLKNYGEVKVGKLPRMADFCTWGCAMADSLGFTQEQFLQAYYTSIGQQHDEAIAGSVTASVLVDFMADKPEWLGTPSELYLALTEKAKDGDINTRSGAWPKNPTALSKNLDVVRHNLEQKGLELDRQRTGDKRTVKITNHESPEKLLLEVEV